MLSPLTIVFFVALFLIVWAYYPLFETMWNGATPGKRGGAIAGAVAGLSAAIGGLMFWRKRRGKGESATSS